MDEKSFAAVCDQARRAALLSTTADALEWDERTGMPPQAAEYRAEQVALLRGLAHQAWTDPRYGAQLQALSESLPELDPHGDVATTIRELHRDWDRNRRLPQELVARIAAAAVRGQQCWQAARAADDDGGFRQSLREMIQLKQEAGARLADGTGRTVYEALLDEYEPGARVDALNAAFQQLRTELVSLLRQITAAPRQPPTALLSRDFDLDRQRQLGREVAERVGFDFSRGRLDETAHPFCTTLGPRDCRILTRYQSAWLPAGLFGTLHEAGHGMYEQGLRDRWFGLPPGQYVSLGVHESQSRLWENQVGRSRAFWQWLFPRFCELFPGQTADVSLDDVYFAVNAVAPSLIRVEADEVTYNLHIIIRFELEQQLMDGSLTVADLSAAWDEHYQTYLGIAPTSAASGYLQDVHWSAGLFGYFPTYTWGNLISAQLFEAATAELGDLATPLARGDFASLLQWLREQVHARGRCYGSTDLVQRVTGSPPETKSLVRYLKEKLAPLYRW